MSTSPSIETQDTPTDIVPCPVCGAVPAQQTRPAAFLAWAVDMFGPVAKLRSERLLRFIEEAIELAHAEGMDRGVLNLVGAGKADILSKGLQAGLRFPKETINYVNQYGGNCRDCADNRGVCPVSGLPCAQREKAIKWVVDAINYGVGAGFLRPSVPRPERGGK